MAFGLDPECIILWQNGFIGQEYPRGGGMSLVATHQQYYYLLKLRAVPFPANGHSVFDIICPLGVQPLAAITNRRVLWSLFHKNCSERATACLRTYHAYSVPSCRIRPCLEDRSSKLTTDTCRNEAGYSRTLLESGSLVFLETSPFLLIFPHSTYIQASSSLRE